MSMAQRCVYGLHHSGLDFMYTVTQLFTLRLPRAGATQQAEKAAGGGGSGD